MTSNRPVHSRKYLRRGILVLLALILGLPASVWSSFHGLQAMTNHPLQWIPTGTVERAHFGWFSEQFGYHDPIVVSWEGCTLGDERIEAFVRGLHTRMARNNEDRGDPPLFDSITSGRSAIRELTTGPFAVSQRTAVNRLRHFLIGADGRSTVIVVGLSASARSRSRQAVDLIYRVARTDCGLKTDQVYLGGPAVESAEIDSASRRSLVENLAPSALAAMLVTWLCLRSLWMTLAALFTAMVCECFAVAGVYLVGDTFSGLLIVVPALIFVLFMSGTVHLSNYYYDEVDGGKAADAPAAAVRKGWFPCALAAITTAVGIYSLSASKIQPVDVFARHAGTGVLLAFAVLILVIPALFVLRSRQIQPRERRGTRPSTTGAEPRQRLQQFADPVLAHPYALSVVFGIVLVFGCAGLFQLEATVDQDNFFSPESKVIRDSRRLENIIGPFVPLEVLLRLPEETRLSMIERVELVHNVAAQLKSSRQVGSTASVATFVPPLGPKVGFRAIISRRLAEAKLQRHRSALIESNYLAVDKNAEWWRISARVSANAEYKPVMLKIRQIVQRTLDAQPSAEPGSVEVSYSGLFTLIGESRRQLLKDLAVSFGVAMVLIVAALVIAYRSVTIGLISAIPNVFPAISIFGMLGWTGWKLDIGAMMTASVGLGIAVDDTVHYLTWFTRSRREGQSPESSARTAYDRCGGAMIRTSAICAAGLVVFVFSPLVPASRFATMICLLLMATLVGDLVLLPALLCGPFRSFHRNLKHTGKKLDHDPATTTE